MDGMNKMEYANRFETVGQMEAGKLYGFDWETRNDELKAALKSGAVEFIDSPVAANVYDGVRYFAMLGNQDLDAACAWLEEAYVMNAQTNAYHYGNRYIKERIEAQRSAKIKEVIPDELKAALKAKKAEIMAEARAKAKAEMEALLASSKPKAILVKAKK